jgi:hypothetical protein
VKKQCLSLNRAQLAYKAANIAQVNRRCLWPRVLDHRSSYSMTALGGSAGNYLNLWCVPRFVVGHGGNPPCRKQRAEHFVSRRRSNEMMKVSIHQRSEIESFYPANAFAFDAGINSDAKATVLRGIRIVSSVSDDGSFAIDRGSRHVGEAASGPDDCTFLAPFLTDHSVPQVAAGDGQKDRPSHDRKADEYAGFIDEVILAASTKEARPQPKPDDERLRGPHGG